MLPSKFNKAQYNASLSRIAEVFLGDRCQFHIEHFSEGQSEMDGFHDEHERIVLAAVDRTGIPIDSAQSLFEKMKKILGDDLALAHDVDTEGRPFVSVTGINGLLTTKDLFNLSIKAERSAGLGRFGC